MATRKKKKSTPVRRRRRVSGLGGSNMNDLLGIAIGAIGAPYVDKAIEKFMPTITDDKILAAIKAGTAIFLIPKIAKGAMGKNIASGMIAVSAVQMAAKLGLYGAGGSGIGSTDESIYMDMSSVNGVDDVINGVNNYDVVNGLGDDLSDMDN